MIINKCYILISLFMLSVAVSCTDMMDVHSEFVKDGEIIYSVKVDSVVMYPGNERMRIKGFMKNALQVKTINVSWQNSDKSISTEVFPYDYSQSPDSFILELNVPEGQYIFGITSQNAQGNASVQANAFSKIFGEKYRRYLTNRTIKEMTSNITGGVIITFDPPATNLAVVNLNYTTVTGSSKSVDILPSQTEIIIEDVDLYVPINYSSGYSPDEMSIDTLFCDVEEVRLESLIDASL